MLTKFLSRFFAHKSPPIRPVRLLHATHLRINLPEILQDGLLLSYTGLVKKYGWEEALKRIHDRNRYDLTQAPLKDFTNAGFSRVPADYLFRLCGQSWRMEWIAIELDEKILEWSDWIAAPAGAAKRDATLFQVPADCGWQDALNRCFEKNVDGVSRPETETIFGDTHPFPAGLPTHPDCELLLPAPVGREHWKRLIVADAAVRKTVTLLVEKSHYRDLPVEIDKTVFYRHPSASSR